MSAQSGNTVTEILTRGTSLLLAPMATVTYSGFRELVHEFGGCDLYWTEMISAEALCGGSPYESYYLDAAPAPERTIYQLVGYGHEALEAAAARLSREPVAGIDLNFACPAPAIVRKGGGIAWTTEQGQAFRLVEAVRRVCGTMSLSVKLRLPDDGRLETLVSFARGLRTAGADFLTLHPKRRRDGAAREARWSLVQALREEVSIPIVGNGGVTGWETLQSRLRQGGSGPVMIGRGAVRAPWLFAYLKNRMAGGPATFQVDLRQVALRFHALLERTQPADFLPTRARRFYPYFLANFRFGHTPGARLAQERDYRAGKEALYTFLDEHEEEIRYVERS